MTLSGVVLLVGQTEPPAAAPSDPNTADATVETPAGDLNVNVQVEPDPGAAAAEDEPQSFTSVIEDLQLGRMFHDNTWRQWLVLLGGIFFGLLIGKIASWALRNAGARLEKRGWRARGEVFVSAAGPAALAIFAAGLGFGLLQLSLSEFLQKQVVPKAISLLYAGAVFWFLFNLINVVEIGMRMLASRTHSTLDDQLVPILRKTLRIFLLVLAALWVAGSIFEADIGAWLAGLGIAGLAVSLAAQDSLKNFFGSMTILFDKPFQVGERIKYGGFDGTVEEIGFRSTRVRTFEGHLITIPNLTIVNDSVENVSKRPYLRRIMDVTITCDTAVNKIEEAVAILRGILEEPGIAEPIHGRWGKDDYPPRVYFNKLNADSWNIQVAYWYMPVDWWAYMEHGQRVNLRILDEFNKAGIEFAFPTQTLYLAGDPKRELTLKMLGAGMGG